MFCYSKEQAFADLYVMLLGRELRLVLIVVISQYSRVCFQLLSDIKPEV